MVPPKKFGNQRSTFEFGRNFMPIDYNEFLDLPANKIILVMNVQGLSPEDNKRGMLAAAKVFDDARVHAYTARRASETLDEIWHDVTENPDARDSIWEFFPLCIWADVWTKAVESAIEAATRGMPEDRYQFQLTLDWDGLEPGDPDIFPNIYIRGSKLQKSEPYAAWFQADSGFRAAIGRKTK